MSSPETETRPTPHDGPNARACWEVLAGFIPGQPEAEFTKQWWLTSDDVNAEDSHERWTKARTEAYEYAEQITDPRTLNWVRVDWVWF